VSVKRIYALSLAVILWLLASLAFAGAREISGLVLTVSDLERSVAFYETALDFKKVSERTIADRDYDYLTGVFGARVRVATLKLGDETIELEQYSSPAGRPIPVDSRSNDLWFQHFAVVVSDMDKAYEHLRKVPFQAISSAPQTIPASNTAAAGVKAFKFKDPDGHPLELLYFPPDKGRAKWQRRSDRIFLGIDHSAITVASTEKSAAFYRDLLGLAVEGGSVNTGEPQEQLDNAFGAVVRVTGLRPQSDDGPGLEFLQYVTPSGGRAAPIGVLPNDILHVRVVLEVDDLGELASKLTQRNAAFISSQVVLWKGCSCRALMVKDPDGHALMLVQRGS
jgi:catechol 2,3-dioxygenase-like lactoylglutathione lyase family enzyme